MEPEIAQPLTLQQRIPLTIAPHDNVMKNLRLKEVIELTLLDKLTFCPSLLKDTFHDPISTFYYGSGGEKKLLTEYRKNWRQSWIDVQYVRSDNIDYGRFLPNKAQGLHNIRRELRHTLAADNFVDNDIANCHPKMLQQIKNIHGIKGDYLDQYCDDRENWLRRVIDAYELKTHPATEKNPKYPREMAKVLFIILAYGGGTDRWKKNNKIGVPEDADFWEIKNIPDTQNIKDFKADIKRLGTKITEANPHLKAQVIAHKTANKQAEGTYNLQGSVCSYYLQEWEGRILEVMYKYCLEKKYIQNGEAVLCADGIMLMKKYYHDGIPAELEIEIKDKLGFEMVIEKKGMDNGYTKKEIDKACDFLIEDGLFLTGRIANVFRILHSDKFVFNDGILRKFNGVFWEKEHGKNNTTLHDFVNTRFHHYLSGKGIAKLMKVNQEIGLLHHDLEAAPNEADKKRVQASIKLANEQRQAIQAKLTEIDLNCCNIKKRRDLVADIIHAITNPYIMWDDHPFLLAFTNRIIDIRTGEHIPPNYKDYLSMTTKYDWDGYALQERTDLLRILIAKIFPDKKIRHHYMTALSTGLYGQQQENLFIATGVGGNGKSLINGLMLHSVGEYGYDMPKSVLQEEKAKGADPEIAKLHKKRFVLTTEPSQNKKIQTATMKKITGDQSVEARMLYENGLEGGVQLTISLFLEANRLPELDEITEGINRRLEVYPFQSRFLKPHVLERLTKGMSPEELEDSHLYLGDTVYKTKDWKQDHAQAFIGILLEYFKEFHKAGNVLPEPPKVMADAKEEYMTQSDDLFSWFDGQYERIPTEDKYKHKVLYLPDLYSTFKVHDYYNKQSRDLQKRYSKRDNFIKDLKDNLFISVFIKNRDTIYPPKSRDHPEYTKTSTPSCKPHKKDYLYGWKERVDLKDDSDEEIDSDDDDAHAGVAEEKQGRRGY